MRYQEYKKRMEKIRKVLDFFYRFRFVFAGVTAAIIAGVVALDVSKGSITNTTKFEISYVYGEKMTYSGSAFMGNVTFEFRKAGEKDWTEEEPKTVGSYEARAKSKGNHGYKYSEISKFEITPIEKTILIKDDVIKFGNDHPNLSCTLIGKDKIGEEYLVNYEDLTKNSTTASLDLKTIKIIDENNNDVTNCYTLKTEDKEISFQKEKLTFTFADVANNYDGEEYTADEYEMTGNLYYGGQVKVSNGKSLKEVGSVDNAHEIKIIDEEGKDYTENYDITIKDSNVTINKAPAINISSNDLSKVYDGYTFSSKDFTYEAEGVLPIHTLKVTFDKTDDINVTKGNNSFTYTIKDSDDKDASSYYQGINITFGSFEIKKRPAAISSNNLTVSYDAREKSQADITYDSTEFADNEHPESSMTYDPVVEPGQYNNTHAFVVIHEEEIEGVLQRWEVTDNYDLTIGTGKININVKPLEFKFTSQSFDYDGDVHNYYTDGNKATITDETADNLPEGFTYDVSVSKTMKYYSEDGYIANEDDVTVKIFDHGSNDVTDRYIAADALSYVFATSTINKIPLEITVADFSKVYDQESFNDSISLVGGIASRVTSTGLLAGDTLNVDYSKQSDKSITNYTKDYPVVLTYTVKNASNVNVTSCYDLSFTNEDKETSTLNITKREITLRTKDVSKVYDENNLFEPDIEFVSGNLGNESIEIIEKDYAVESDAYTSVGYSYELTADDLKIKKNTADLTGNYTIINIENTGKVFINKRPVDVTQKAGTSTFIYFDNENHGVFTNSNEVQIESYNANNHSGLLNGHTMSFGDDTSYHSYNPPYEDAILYNAAAHSNFSPTIRNATNIDVTNNYEINCSNFNIRIIKKTISISSKTLEKYFDGFTFDKYRTMSASEYRPIGEMDNIIDAYNVTGYLGSSVDLDEGHAIQVTKTKADILTASINAGSYENQFDVKVIDTLHDNADVTYFYHINRYYGSLNVYQTVINVACQNYTKTYDGSEITLPVGEFEVTEGSHESGAFIKTMSHSTNSDTQFSDKFKVIGDFPAPSYPNYYESRSYSSTPTLSVRYRDTDAVYSNASNVVINTVAGREQFVYTINTRPITINVFYLMSTPYIYITNGSIATGDSLYINGNYVNTSSFLNGKYNYSDYASLDLHSATIEIHRGLQNVTSSYDITIN